MDTKTRSSSLTEVRFVGGPLHGRSALMANPEFNMPMEFPDGEPIIYCRRIVESTVLDGQEIQVATYAPVGLVDHEFERLVLDAAKRGSLD